MRRRSLGLVFAVLASAALPGATQAPPQPTTQTSRLDEFEGEYDYRDGATLYVVRSGDHLVAIIGDGKYPLKGAGSDAFTNRSGDRVPFLRDAQGRVRAFAEGGDTFARRATAVPRAARQLLEARTASADGSRPRYRYAVPTRDTDGLAVGAAGSGTLPVEAAEALVNGVIDGTYPDVHAVAVYHKGALRLDEYFYGHDRTRPHQMRSLTKSVVSLLAGIAADRRRLDPRAAVLDALPYAAVANPDPRKSRITVLDLLSHRSGLACNDYDGASPGNESTLYEAEDWVKAFIDLPVAADPGTVAHYCSGGIFTAGRVVERAVGTPLPDFARDALFEPLGIAAADWRWPFVLQRRARAEFGQIYLRPRDLVKIGLLLAQRGTWQGRRVVSAEWVDAAVGKQSRIDDTDYGYGIWHRWYQVDGPDGPRRIDTIMLSGNGGQKVYIVPFLDLVAAFTGGAYNTESAANAMMSRVLLPALLSASRAG